MSVLFFNPPNPVVVPRGTFIVRPMGLFSLVASLEAVGIPAHVADLNRFPMSEGELLKLVHDNGYRIFGFGASTFTRFSAISLMNLLKQHFPDRPIIAGGPHFSKAAEDALQKIPSLDLVVRGEGERVVQELVPLLLDGGDWSNVHGISYRADSSVYHNSDAAKIEDHDSLPIFTGFRYEDYPEVLGLHKEDGKAIPAVGMLTSRGCPNRCQFCSATDGTYRARSPEAVVDEMKMWMDRFPQVRGFNIFDLTFTADPDRVRRICEEIRNQGLNIRWWAESRIDIDLDLLDLMYESGCRGLSVGVETGSPRILREINKNVTLDMVYDFAQRTDSLGMWMDVFIMFSHPSETLDDLRMTLELIRNCLKRFKKVFYLGGGGVVTSIHPGSPLEYRARGKGIIDKHFSWHEPFYQPENLDLACSPYVPIYLENISRSDLRGALRKSNHWIEAKRKGRLALYKRLAARAFTRDTTFQHKLRAAWNRIETLRFV